MSTGAIKKCTYAEWKCTIITGVHSAFCLNSTPRLAHKEMQEDFFREICRAQKKCTTVAEIDRGRKRKGTTTLEMYKKSGQMYTCT